MNQSDSMDSTTGTGTATGSNKRRKSFWRKLLLLMWKNLLLRRRHWLLTAFEILLPTLLFTLLVTIRVLPDSSFIPHFVDHNSTFDVTSERELREIFCNEYGVMVGGKCSSPWIEKLPAQRKIFYGPHNNFTAGVANYLADSLGITRKVLSPVSSNEDMDVMVDKSYFEADNALPTFYVGLYFNDLQDDQPPEKLDYFLRLSGYWFTELIYPFLQIPGPRNFSLFGDTHGGYNMNGFTLIQSIVDRYYVSLMAGDNDTDYNTQYEIETQMYPYPPYVQDNGMSQFYGSSLPLFVVLSLVLLSPSLIKSVVYEKETGVRELIRLMGLSGWLVWFGWFLHSFVIILLVSSIMTFFLKVELMPATDASGYLPAILAYSDPFFVWVLFVLYGICSISFCFVISTFFSKPTMATTIGILIWLCSYFIPSTLMYDYNNLSQTAKLLSCLLPNMAITWAFKVMAMFEGRTLGIQWHNVWETGNPRDELTPAAILLMMVLDTFLFLFLVWYVDQISPGKYGVPLPFYFPFQRSYWCGTQPESVTSSTSDSDDPTSHYFEEEPEGLRPGIVIRNLRKEFRTLGGKVKVAVEDVSMTCYEGQCTVLLGHNGAGKTTTMSILTGVYAPSGGQAEVGGWNIATHLREAREELGLCPQHNMLFVDLTVLQHLLFFGRLKGLTTKAAEEEAVELLGRLDLLDKKNMFGNQLSGGMKRKLSLAISLIGGSKVVILDEPSSGLDPESRRWVWDVVQGERGRRTILVTTHHMEEADVLGDRVAIMASGKVVCAGSTFFLKNKFGDGYTLNLVVSQSCDARKLMETCRKEMPSIKLLRGQGGEYTAILPQDTAKFAPLLESLSRQKQELQLRHIGLSLTSMEKVFLRVGEVAAGEPPVMSRPQSAIGFQNGNSYESLNGSTSIAKDVVFYNSQRHLFSSQNLVDGRLAGTRLLAQRIKGFLIKRIIYFKRKWLLLVTQALLPVLVTVACLLMDANLASSAMRQPPLELNLTMFPYSQSFVLSDPSHDELADAYKSFFWEPYKVNSTDNMDATLLEEGEKDIFRYRENNICSAEFLDGESGKTAMRMRYQSIPFHAPGISTSIISNALLRFATNSTNHSITTTNYPLPPNKAMELSDNNTSGSSLVYSMMMPLALALLTASFLVFPLQERETKAKQIQVMTGAPLWGLWLSTFIWDYLTYLASSLVIFAAFMIGDTQKYFTVDAAPAALLLLLLLYGWGSIPLAYVFSFFFQTAAAGFAVLTLISIVAGMIITIAVWALDLSNQPDLLILSDALHWITSILPAYPASMGFKHMVNTSDFNTQCDMFNSTLKEQLCDNLYIFQPNASFVACCPKCATTGMRVCFQKRSYFAFDEYGMSQDMLTLTINGFIFFILLFLIDSGFFTKLRMMLQGLCRKKTTPTDTEVTLDNDVVAEAELVNNLLAGVPLDPPHETSLIVSGLSKTFVGANRPAVNEISFHVGRGECLGLLGVNGAGKTTTFRMLTGDEVPSSGDARIGNTSLSGQVRKFIHEIGYCPQFDAVLGELTGEETLMLLGRLRGISDISLPHSVSELIFLVGLTECAKRPSSTYSGGNKRKLSTAMALIGDPPLVFLDEPTSGVDPASRRRVWAAITKAVQCGQSVVLTSHSMEECEALCSRIIIMSRGTLRCIGSSGHLKAKFGKGYSLQVKLRMHNDRLEDDQQYAAQVLQLKTTIRQRLAGAVLTDQHKVSMVLILLFLYLLFSHSSLYLKYNLFLTLSTCLYSDVKECPCSLSLISSVYYCFHTFLWHILLVHLMMQYYKEEEL
ncbi:phospholipid-transporting ATPase ABCA1-like isoform X1 [Portunus trituberculatus]|uniref:phospholipid-transporting ATPase ABCA1-like isoform X1 n=1 Tax=Portunus trituberculatus TaxID=210409 RepID=UPI001E1CC45D|nr:phospholipid-transporting ATPase ABCA1-like isoform X1 [Portunus trituberculatus]XP_045131215.1 phospholipid-transporting ATPase ABCA1-like isoform X1 [Portunus trituberculatus]XP_045131216.1 phospholipid-transporting ATPase ABCA1-like isoform X1 [Portunus trituberculatus]